MKFKQVKQKINLISKIAGQFPSKNNIKYKHLQSFKKNSKKMILYKNIPFKKKIQFLNRKV